jgi:N-acetylmuramoyl-L-alanine amidase
MRNINEIIVHCAATPEGKDFTVSDIDRWHKGRGWSGIGYHYVVYRDGSVHKGRPVWKVGAHVKGRNRNTIGICYIGGVARDGRTAKDTRTSAQKAALVKLLMGLLDEFPKIKKISGHNQYAAKACPSFNAGSEYKALLRDKKPLVKSRTIQGSVAAVGGGAAVLVEPVKDLTTKLSDQQAQLASGDFVTVAIGAVIVLGALYALYARWDDAGRPKPWS